MKRVLAIAMLLGGLPAAPAQPGGGEFLLPRTVIAAGGGSSSGGGFELSGTLGQAVVEGGSSGGGFTLAAGFWAGGEVQPPGNDIFADGFESPPG